MRIKIALAFAFFTLLLTPALASAPRALDIGAGAQVWFEEDHTVPMVAVSIALPAGSVYDPAFKSGLAAFAAAAPGAGCRDPEAAGRCLSLDARTLEDLCASPRCLCAADSSSLHNKSRLAIHTGPNRVERGAHAPSQAIFGALAEDPSGVQTHE